MGVPLSEVLIERTTQAETTKYDCDTGQPYQKVITDSVTYVGTSDIQAEDYYELTRNPFKFDIGYVSRDYIDNDATIVGKCIKALRDLNYEWGSWGVDLDAVAQAKQEVQERLAQYGITEPVQLYLVANVSC